MTPAAVDLIKLTTLELPAPTASPPPADAPSFQEHLQRAERRTSDDTNSSDDRRSASTDNASSPPAPADARKSNDSGDDADADRPAEAKREDSGKVEGQKKPDDPSTDDDAERAIDGAEEGTIVATTPQVVAAALAEAEPTAEDTEIETGTEVDAQDVKQGAAVAAAAKAKNVAVSPVAASIAVVATEEAAAAVTEPAADTEAATADSNAAKVATVVEPVIAAVQPLDPREKQVEATQHEIATPKAAADPTASEVTLSSAVQGDAAPDKETSHHRNEGGKDARDPTPTATTPAAATDAPSPNVAPSTPAETTIAAATSTLDNQAPTKGQDSTSTIRTGDAPTTRHDRAPAAEPPRPTGHRDVGASRTSSTETSSTISQTDRVRLVQRVARAVQTAQERGGDLKLRLSPPELGSLRLQVRLTDGALSARIETDNPAAKQVLIDSLPALRDRLAEQNIRVEQFDVDLSNSGNGGGAADMQQQRFDDAGDGGSRTATGRTTRARTAAVAESVVDRTAAPAVGDGRLNVIV